MTKLSLAVLLLLVASAFADEQTIQLRDAPGRDVVLNSCGACHSLDYIQINAPFPDEKLWRAEVTKMISVFGAPIDEADAKTITEYLVKNYGAQGPS